MIFVKVSESESDESVELPVEQQGYILMSTLTAQFPGACGLKFKTEQASWRGVRVVEDKLYPPGEDKWDESCVYIVTFPKDSKRKGGDDLDVINSAKSRKIERKCVDLIVLGIPWKSTEDVVRAYFEQHGEVVLCEIKRDAANNSKGFGFVRFKDYASQISVLGKKHFIDGRWCDVKIPNSQEPETSRKIFVGRLSETLTQQDLQEYFEQYGQVVDVYIPKPFRAFGFVTFVEADVAQSLCGESHIIKGVSVHVSRADPKDDDGSHAHGPTGGAGGYQPGGYHANAHSGGHGPHGGHGGGHGGPHGGGGYGGHGGPHGGHGGGGGGGRDNHHHRNDGGPRRFAGNGHINHSNGNGLPQGGGGGMSGSKSTGQIRNKANKFDNESIYDPARHNDVRSPNMPPGPVGNNSQAGAGSNDQMNAMMNMFNPMMAAFIQQLASGIQPNGAEPNGVGPVSAPGGGGGGMHPSASWHSGNSGPGYGNQGGGGGGGGFQNGGGVGRFKGEKNFVNN